MKILMTTGYYPCSRKPSEGTFFDRRIRQLADNGIKTKVLTTKVLTPATFLRSLGDVLDFLRTPQNFSYNWNNQQVEGFRIILPVPSKIAPRIQAHFFYRAVSSLGLVSNKKKYDAFMIAHGGPFAQAVAKYADENGVCCITWATGGGVIKSFDKPHSRAYHREKGIMLASKLVVCVSKDIASKVRQMTDDRVETMTFYTGVDTRGFCPDPGLRLTFRTKLKYHDKLTVLSFVGHMIRAKGIYELFRVFARLSATDDSLRLLLVGSVVERRQVKKSIQQLGIQTKVNLTGAVSHDQIVGYLNATDLFVFPSWSEGLPNAVLEACSCGLPVLTTSVGGIPEIITSGKNGLLVPPCNEELLYSSARRLIADPNLCAALGAAAREDMVRRFNSHKNGKILVEKIREIVVHEKGNRNTVDYDAF